jgi:ubiquitin-protein ligase
MSNSKVSRRLLGELRDYEKNKEIYNREGIFIFFNEENITNGYFCLVAKEEPYLHGLFIFTYSVPSNYPMVPPNVKFIQFANKNRMNPNLYVEGKVCLSLLGTWSGPGWTPLNKLVNVAQSIQALVLCKNPLYNEPGFERYKETDKIITFYTQQMYILTLYYHIFNMLEQQAVDENLQKIYDLYREYYEKNRDKILEYTTKILDTCSPNEEELTTKYATYSNTLSSKKIFKYLKNKIK